MKESDTESAEKLARLLALLEPSRGEILERHGAAIDAWVRACTGERSQPAGNLIELCRGWFVRLLPNMEEFQAGLGVLSGGLAGATRGATKGGGPEDAGPERGTGPGVSGHFIGRGERCFGQLIVRPQPDGRLTLEFCLRDPQWTAIQPFVLTVRQQTTILLDHKRIDGDRYQVPNIAPAAYQFELSDVAGARRVAMGWTQS